VRPLPGWVASVVERGNAPIPVHDVVRSAITVPLVLVVMYTAVDANAALFASIAALLVVLSERSGTTGQRALKTGAGLCCGTLAMLLGPYSAGTGLTPLLVVAGFGLLGGIMSGFGAALSFAGMQGIVQMSIAGGLVVDFSTRDRVASYLVGGAAAFAIAMAQSLYERTDRLYFQALRDVRASLEQWHTRPSAPETASARRRTDALLLAARDLLAAARPRRRRRMFLIDSGRREYAQLAATVTMTLAGTPETTHIPTSDAWEAPAASGASAGTVPVYSASSAPAEAAAPSPPAPPAAPVEPLRPTQVRVLLRTALRRRATWDFVIRLETCLVIGELLRQLLPWGHSYWVLLTIALSLKPDIGPVYPRTMQRALGTVAGIGLGWLAVVLSPGYPAVPVLVVLGAFIPFSVRRNYGLFTVAITPMVLILMDLGQELGVEVLGQRVASTLVGCLVVLTLGNAWWPSTRRSAVRQTAIRLHERVHAFPAGALDLSSVADERLELATAIATFERTLTVRAGEPRRTDRDPLARHTSVVSLETELLRRLRRWGRTTPRTWPVMNHPQSPTRS
jgi:hypothetical protein